MSATWWNEPHEFRLSRIQLKTVCTHPASYLFDAVTKVAGEWCEVVRWTATIYLSIISMLQVNLWKKKNPITVGQAQRDKAPPTQQAGLYKSCIEV